MYPVLATHLPVQQQQRTTEKEQIHIQHLIYKAETQRIMTASNVHDEQTHVVPLTTTATFTIVHTAALPNHSTQDYSQSWLPVEGLLYIVQFSMELFDMLAEIPFPHEMFAALVTFQRAFSLV